MDELLPLLGKEQDFDTISAALRRGIRRLDPGGVGAFHITCADESEHEATQAFERGVCRDHLPRLKYAQAVPFRTINAGARYDQGTLAICEDHFALGQEREGFKLVIVKIQGHCSRARDEAGVMYGQRERYGHLSTYCGAIAAMLGGAELPLVKEMHAAIDADAPGALDRITDTDRVPERHTALLAALLSARVQAGRIARDAESHTPRTPTLYWILHGVTLNQEGLDDELPGGLIVVDRREGESGGAVVHGLGLTAEDWAVEEYAGRVRIRSSDLPEAVEQS